MCLIKRIFFFDFSLNFGIYKLLRVTDVGGGMLILPLSIAFVIIIFVDVIFFAFLIVNIFSYIDEFFEIKQNI